MTPDETPPAIGQSPALSRNGAIVVFGAGYTRVAPGKRVGHVDDSSRPPARRARPTLF